MQHSYAQILITRDILTQYEDEINVDEFNEFVYDLFKEVVETEQQLSRSMFDGVVGIDIVEVEMYVEWRANMLLRNMGLEEIFPTKRNPMRWITVFDPENINQTKSDSFESQNSNYTKGTDANNGWGDLL